MVPWPHDGNDKGESSSGGIGDTIPNHRRLSCFPGWTSLIDPLGEGLSKWSTFPQRPGHFPLSYAYVSGLQPSYDSALPT